MSGEIRFISATDFYYRPQFFSASWITNIQFFIYLSKHPFVIRGCICEHKQFNSLHAIERFYFLQNAIRSENILAKQKKINYIIWISYRKLKKDVFSQLFVNASNYLMIR